MNDEAAHTRMAEDNRMQQEQNSTYFAAQGMAYRKLAGRKRGFGSLVHVQPAPGCRQEVYRSEVAKEVACVAGRSIAGEPRSYVLVADFGKAAAPAVT